MDMHILFSYKDYEAFPHNAGFEEETIDSGKKENFEKYPTGLKAGIKIQNLGKLFSTPQGVCFLNLIILNGNLMKKEIIKL